MLFRSHPYSQLSSCSQELFYTLFLPNFGWSVNWRLGRQLILMWAVMYYSGQLLKDVMQLPRPPCPPVVHLEKHFADVRRGAAAAAVSRSPCLVRLLTRGSCTGIWLPVDARHGRHLGAVLHRHQVDATHVGVGRQVCVAGGQAGESWPIHVRLILVVLVVFLGTWRRSVRQVMGPDSGLLSILESPLQTPPLIWSIILLWTVAFMWWITMTCSRLFLGVHSFVDVFAGMVLGCTSHALALLCVRCAA